MTDDQAFIDHIFMRLSSPDFIAFYEVLNRVGDADLLRLFTTADVDTRMILNASGSAEHSEALRKVRVLRDLRAIGRKIVGAGALRDGGTNN